MSTSPRPVDERIKELDEKIAQIQARKKAILAREKDAERKARTKRLIEIGAEVEAAFGFALDTPEMRKALGEFIREQNRRGHFATKAVTGKSPTEIGSEVN